MLFAVRHATRYRYSLPIVPAPHVLRLTPRPEHSLLSRTLVVRPEPVEVRSEVDAYGNLGTRVVFPEAATEELVIESSWRGWDPTHGIPVTDGHVALCAAPAHAGTMPVVGSYSFSGSSLTSTLDFDLRIRTS